MTTPTLRDVMSTDLLTAAMDQPVSDAARLMQRGDVGLILCVDDAGRLAGVMSDRDLVVRVIAMGLDPNDTRLGDVASTDLHVLTPGDPLDAAVKLMRDHAIRRVPIVVDGTPVGIVSIGDIAERKDRASALAEISASRPNV